MQTIITILVSVFSFGLMIILHEAGHFVTARKLGIRVETFSIGLGPPIYKKTVDGVDYAISLLPIGGYVKMPDSLTESKATGIPFNLARTSSKLVVLAAGSIMNILSGFVVMTLLFLQMNASAGLSLLTAIRTAAGFFVQTIYTSAISLYQFFLTTNISFSEVSGPVGVSQIIGEGFQTSLSMFVLIFAVISINIGVFNLLPIPALDGGRILFVGIERIMKNRFPVQTQEKLHGAGMITLLFLILLVTVKDVIQLFV